MKWLLPLSTTEEQKKLLANSVEAKETIVNILSGHIYNVYVWYLWQTNQPFLCYFCILKPSRILREILCQFISWFTQDHLGKAKLPQSTKTHSN